MSSIERLSEIIDGVEQASDPNHLLHEKHEAFFAIAQGDLSADEAIAKCRELEISAAELKSWCEKYSHAEEHLAVAGTRPRWEAKLAELDRTREKKRAMFAKAEQQYRDEQDELHEQRQAIEHELRVCLNAENRLAELIALRDPTAA